MRGTITSVHNPKIKSILALGKPRERRKQCLFVIEGRREVAMAAAAGYKIGNIFYCEDQLSRDALDPGLTAGRLVIPVTQAVFDKIAVRENSGGLIAVAEQKTHELDRIILTDNPLILVLEAVEKPGNLGAVFRTASAAGMDAVLVGDPRTDLYNPNVIRSSLGCIFTVPCGVASSGQIMAWLAKTNVRIVCTHLKASRPYYELDFTKPTAIVMGSEASGLTDAWIGKSAENIVIPMQGLADSLNVSVSAAIIAFEARRQRRSILREGP